MLWNITNILHRAQNVLCKTYANHQHQRFSVSNSSISNVSILQLFNCLCLSYVHAFKIAGSESFQHSAAVGLIGSALSSRECIWCQRILCKETYAHTYIMYLRGSATEAGLSLPPAIVWAKPTAELPAQRISPELV